MMEVNDDCVYVKHEGLVHETHKGEKEAGAKLFTIRGRNIWVPKVLIESDNAEIVAIKGWWAKKNGIKGDW